jgi:hypothetical protein
MSGEIIGTWNSCKVTVDGEILKPAVSQRIRNHSPGFSWGYEGSGPAHLALGILLKFTDIETATRFYQDFKFGVIARLPQADFVLPIKTVEDWIEKAKA